MAEGERPIRPTHRTRLGLVCQRDSAQCEVSQSASGPVKPVNPVATSSNAADHFDSFVGRTRPVSGSVRCRRSQCVDSHRRPRVRVRWRRVGIRRLFRAKPEPATSRCPWPHYTRTSAGRIHQDRPRSSRGGARSLCSGGGSETPHEGGGMRRPSQLHGEVGRQPATSASPVRSPRGRRAGSRRSGTPTRTCLLTAFRPDPVCSR